MRKLWFAMLLASSFLLAQDSTTGSARQSQSKTPNGEITVQGCLSRASGDYVLMRQDPAVTYQLQATGKTRLGQYLGQRVEITGTESPTMMTSSDALNRTGPASPVTITVTSIRTVAKQCVSHQALSQH